jgi:hypothetical protein
MFECYDEIEPNSSTNKVMTAFGTLVDSVFPGTKSDQFALEICQSSIFLKRVEYIYTHTRIHVLTHILSFLLFVLCCVM